MPVKALICGLLIGAGLAGLPDAVTGQGQRQPATAATSPASTNDQSPSAASDVPRHPAPPSETPMSNPAANSAVGGKPRPASSAYPRPPADSHPVSYGRSLVYSGLLGLAISMTGLAMVGRRRRLW